jgi:predicted GTPase
LITLDKNEDNLDKIVGCLEELKRNVQIIDIYHLQRLIKSALKTKSLIKGKDIIVMLGNTGCGKSTIILKFLGNNFKAIEDYGSTVYVPEDLKEEHKSFHTSFSIVSCTSHINAAPIPK